MRLYNILLFIFFSLLATSCSKDSPELIKHKKFRTVITYLAANNNLNTEAYLNINQMEEAIGDVDGDMIVYARLKGVNPAIYHIQSDNSSEIKSEKIKEYPPHNSSDPQVMRTILEDIKMLYPSETYGLILWSHASGWIPSDYVNIKLKSFGDDNGSNMDIKQLNHALPYNFDFILFDACSMASIEVLYEIKEKAKYFIASPGEVISNGMPYNKIINDLFEKSESSYLKIAEKYFNHYNQMTGLHQSATISVIQADQLELLGNLTNELLSSNQIINKDFNRDKIQRMDFEKNENPLIAFDFGDFINQNFAKPQLNSIVNQLNKTILYKANTRNFNGIPINIYTGLTCYIPHTDNENKVHSYYRTLKWYQNSGFNKLF